MLQLKCRLQSGPDKRTGHGLGPRAKQSKKAREWKMSCVHLLTQTNCVTCLLTIEADLTNNINFESIVAEFAKLKSRKKAM